MAIRFRDYKTRNEYLDALWEATKHYDRYQGPSGRSTFYDEAFGSPEAPRYSSALHYFNAKDQALSGAPVRTSDWVAPESSWVPAPESRVPAPSPWAPASQPRSTASQPRSTASQSGAPASQSGTTAPSPWAPASQSGSTGLLPSSATAPQPMLQEPTYTKSYSDRAHAAITTPRYSGNYSSVPESFMPSWMRGGSAPAPAPTGNKGLLPALDREHSSVPEHLMPEWLRGRSSEMADMIPPEWREGTSGG